MRNMLFCTKARCVQRAIRERLGEKVDFTVAGTERQKQDQLSAAVCAINTRLPIVVIACLLADDKEKAAFAKKND